MFLLAAALATLIPLNDLGPAPYDYGYIGGLWDDGTNTMPFILDAVRAYATVGEISDALRDVFGTYQEPALF